MRSRIFAKCGILILKIWFRSQFFKKCWIWNWIPTSFKRLCNLDLRNMSTLTRLFSILASTVQLSKQFSEHVASQRVALVSTNKGPLTVTSFHTVNNICKDKLMTVFRGAYTITCFVSISAKFAICTLVGLNGTLVKAKIHT